MGIQNVTYARRLAQALMKDVGYLPFLAFMLSINASLVSDATHVRLNTKYLSIGYV